jgi:hypothetical protein
VTSPSPQAKAMRPRGPLEWGLAMGAVCLALALAPIGAWDLPDNYYAPFYRFQVMKGCRCCLVRPTCGSLTDPACAWRGQAVLEGPEPAPVVEGARGEAMVVEWESREGSGAYVVRQRAQGAGASGRALLATAVYSKGEGLRGRGNHCH